MKKFAYALLSIVLLAGAPMATVDAASRPYPDQIQAKDRMASHLDVIKGLIEAQYGPIEWKKEYIGWDLHKELLHAKQLIASKEDITEEDFQKILADFVHTLKDYHVHAWFLSPEQATLPFHVKSVGAGKYYFVYIDRTKLSYDSFPVIEGDELVTFDGKPIQEAIDDLKGYTINVAKTDQSLAEISLTNRYRSRGQDVPRGPITIEAKSSQTGRLIRRQLIWDYRSPTPSLENVSKQLPQAFIHHGSSWVGGSWHRPSHRQATVPQRNSNPFLIGAETSFVPTLGPILWHDQESPYGAYVYTDSRGRQIGYLRIAHYDGTEEGAALFQEHIALMETYTDALIIDQLSNPGGELFHTYALLSMLTSEPLMTPKDRVKITSSDAFLASLAWGDFERVTCDEEAKEMLGDTLRGYPVTYMMIRFFVDYCRFIVEQWESGKTLSDPIWPYAVDEINPHPQATYSKPLLVLVNELDFSCADIFPAILQDNKRAVILGTRTAGAGGAVIPVYIANEFGLDFLSLTLSIAERPGSERRPIENLGVTPDVEYQLSEYDLQAGFGEYVSTIHDTIDTLLR